MQPPAHTPFPQTLPPQIQPLQTVEVETGARPDGCVIWLHGLGADGHDFEPIAEELSGGRSLRFVFPHAPVRPVTINGGAQMRAWYDILGLDREAVQDEGGVRASDAAIRELIGREVERGIDSERIVLAGFSQGGAMALFCGVRYPRRLAAIIGLSCYLLLAPSLQAERDAANRATPILLAHGAYDPMIDLRFGESSRSLLEAAGHAVEWHRYAMGHEVCGEEIAAIAAFLKRVL
ncbi:MAG TPA: PHB depolymerase family esterase [Steroidobacteraceae bacterium]|jgi:phospholipase/carboxylesterase|nr:PHB depolymerase family esterase [Steroidobacteraceae bacterium]